MLYTEQTVRDNIRNRDGKRVFFLGERDTLTPGARDYLREQKIELRSAGDAAVQEYRLLSGAVIAQKPEHMTHLEGVTLVDKTHPRILFRGALDTLQGEMMLCQLKCREPIRSCLGEILDHVRQILRCEVMNEPLPEQRLCGLTPEQIRSHSHRPQDFYAQPHFMPAYTDGEAILWINRCRCIAREAERCAVAAFVDTYGKIERQDILKAMNRVSSMLYILMIRLKKGEPD